ncbi:MAG: DNA-deoxyinosine glycosylase [Xanthobacteraceae bacterium]
MQTALVQSFPPITTPDARVLILGSMPSVVSLRAREYYAHRGNAFWWIVGELIGAGLDKPYAERVQILQNKGIAVWDVLKSCVRPGSQDADITAETPNDFETYFKTHLRITHVGLNGSKAAKCFELFARQYCPLRTIVVRLPSTSPAYASTNFNQKCAAWRSILLA